MPLLPKLTNHTGNFKLNRGQISKTISNIFNRNENENVNLIINIESSYEIYIKDLMIDNSNFLGTLISINNSSKLLLNGWQPIFSSVSFKVLRIDQMKVWLHRVFFDSLPQVGDKVSVRSRKSYSRCFSSNRKKLSAASLAFHEKWDHDFFSKHGIWAQRSSWWVIERDRMALCIFPVLADRLKLKLKVTEFSA